MLYFSNEPFKLFLSVLIMLFVLEFHAASGEHMLENLIVTFNLAFHFAISFQSLLDYYRVTKLASDLSCP
jgi:hypothetical protein